MLLRLAQQAALDGAVGVFGEFGVGAALFDAAGLTAHRPASLQPLPPFAIDKLQPQWTGGDLLNDWITPIGSAVFAIPPGCPEGSWIGQELLG